MSEVYAATAQPLQSSSIVGVVVIGRDEGERLRRCLDSLRLPARILVYVDSGSSDDSVSMAVAKGASVVSLDNCSRFTAARARNAGFERLRQLAPDVSYVQFVDGDCEMVDGWINTASAFLDQRPKVAAVCGRLRERHPERSLYNRLCDIEWDRAPGEIQACGGIAMMRADAFVAVGGFNPHLIAGEEPELCLRLRLRGTLIWRLEGEMAWHDAAMTRFDQWWRRTMRGGYAAAEGSVLHRGHSGTSYRRKLGRIVLWAIALPMSVLALSPANPWWLALVIAYPLQIARMARRESLVRSSAWVGALFQVIANFPEAAGAAKYFADRVMGRNGTVIEYH